MPYSFQPSRKDDNHDEIVRGLERAGVSVKSVAQFGVGFDIIAGWQGTNWLFEIKDGDKPPSKRALTESEALMRDTWRGQWSVIEALDQAFTIMGVR